MADFDHPPAEVQRYFDSKGLKPSFDWRDLSFDEHATAFSVAKSAGYDILQDVKEALSNAIHTRQDFDEFRRQLEPTLKSKGWWGKKIAIDPAAGEEKIVQLGSPRRLHTIYWANVTSAYAAGEWERIWRTRRVLPYLQYLHTISEHPREEHLAWVGTILLVVDIWWAKHYPPNGWECKCRVRQIGDAEAERLGYDPDNPVEPPDFGTRHYINKRTGEVEDIPVGIDPGWANNPGKTRTENAAQFLAGRVNAMTDAARKAAIDDLSDSWLFKKIAGGGVDFDRGSKDPAMISRGHIAVPFAALPVDLAAAIGATAQAVMLSVADAAKQLERRRTRPNAEGVREPQVTPAHYRIVQRLIDAGEAIVQGATLVVQGSVDGDFWYAAIRRAGAAPSELYLKSLRRGRPERADAPREKGDVVRPAED